MTVRTRIKICGLTREQDVDAAVEAGADAIGLVLYPKSRRFVTVQRAAELARRLPPFVTPVLLFVNETPENVRAACDLIGNATVQFHGDESPADCLAATGNGARPFVRAARIPLADANSFDLLEFSTTTRKPRTSSSTRMSKVTAAAASPSIGHSFLQASAVTSSCLVG